jgi:hypothetical protein
MQHVRQYTEDPYKEVDAQQKQAIYERYLHELRSLTFNSKPIITHLTQLAEHLGAFAPVVARALSDHWLAVPSTLMPTLSVMYYLYRSLSSSSYLFFTWWTLSPRMFQLCVVTWMPFAITLFAIFHKLIFR